jgi:hypothetical protein
LCWGIGVKGLVGNSFFVAIATKNIEEKRLCLFDETPLLLYGVIVVLSYLVLNQRLRTK